MLLRLRFGGAREKSARRLLVSLCAMCNVDLHVGVNFLALNNVIYYRRSIEAEERDK